jgi:hypothetical protein
MRKYGTYCQYCQLGFCSEIEVPQLGLAWLGTFIAQLELENSGSGSSLLIILLNARTHNTSKEQNKPLIHL